MLDERSEEVKAAEALAHVTENPTPVTLAELARVSSAQRPPRETPEQVTERLRDEYIRVHGTTPGGLPRGMKWVPHDTGRLGYAAARRRAQAARLEEKRARRSQEKGHA